MNTERRIKTAAALSHHSTAASIRKALGISKRTLTRYVRDPRWQEFNGKPAADFLPARGQPSKYVELQERIEQVRAGRPEKTWAAIGRELGLTRHQIRYLRQIDPTLQ